MKELTVGRKYVFRGCPWRDWNDKEFIVTRRKPLNKLSDPERYEITRVCDCEQGSIDMETHGPYLCTFGISSIEFFAKEPKDV